MEALRGGGVVVIAVVGAVGTLVEAETVVDTGEEVEEEAAAAAEVLVVQFTGKSTNPLLCSMKARFIFPS